MQVFFPYCLKFFSLIIYRTVDPRFRVVRDAGLPDPDKPSLPLQPKTTATWGPFTATKFFVTATLRPHFRPK